MKELDLPYVLAAAIRHIKATTGKWPTPEALKDFLHREAGLITLSAGDEPWQSYYKDKINEEIEKVLK